MNKFERRNINRNNNEYDNTGLDRLRELQIEKIKDESKNELKRNHEKDHQDYEREAKAIARIDNKSQLSKNHDREDLTGHDIKEIKDNSYNKTMNAVQGEMSFTSKLFSKIIHNKGVEKLSDIGASSFARPNAILVGSITAFSFTFLLFLIARYYGYPLSGTETIAGFFIGWLLGIVIDYIKIEITGNKNS